MSSRRPRRLDAAALSLFLAGVALTLAVLSHDPADLPGRIHPVNPSPHNSLGHSGALLARALRDSLGAGVYPFLGWWLALALVLFVRRRWLRWGLRSTGWLMLVLAVSVAMERWGARLGALFTERGGSIGAWFAALLEGALPGGWLPVTVAAAALVGFIAAFDFIALPVLRVAARALSWMPRLRRRDKGSAPRRASDLIPVNVTGATPDDPSEPESAPDRAETSTSEPPPSPATRTIPIHHHARADAAAEQLAAPLASRVVPVIKANPAPDSDRERFADFKLPSARLLENAQPFDYPGQEGELRARAALLEKTFADYGLKVRVVGINTGPVITQYEAALETGLRVHKVTSLADDIALNLCVPHVRMVTPIPGKNTIGIEIPNEKRAVVCLKEVMAASAKKGAKNRLPLYLGKDAEGRPLVHDLADMPHLLIAGSTGTGKSVCLNSIILSLLMARRPDEVKMIMVDPKAVELSEYGKLPHLIHPVVTDMKKAEAILAWAVDKMEERYDLLRRARVRNLAEFNLLKPAEVLRRIEPADDEERKQIPDHMPYIVIIIDEMADLIMQMRKEVEGHIIRLAQKSRAAGIHLVLATQRPTVDVITGLIKSNLPARICFKVTNKSDSRVVLDQMGADKLLGKGDMLFLPPGTSTLTRGQGTFVSGEEIMRIVAELECEPCYAKELMQLPTNGERGGLIERLQTRDELYEPAVEVVIREGRGSVSLLQRALGIGYGRAARLIDYMAEDGIVGAYKGSNAREVLYTPEQWAEMKGLRVAG
jgi:S-DNA-T family DNA segregation ATPase FtsK/SpoIIIE